MVLLPPVATCVQRVLTRQGHGFADEAATGKMHDAFASARIARRHVIEDPPVQVDEVVAIIEALRSTRGLRFESR